MSDLRTRTTGSTSAGGERRRKRGLGWLWALLALAAIAALVIFLIARNAGDEGDDDGNLDTTNEESSSGEGGDDPATDERSGGDGSGGAGDWATETTAGGGGGGGEGAGQPAAGGSPLTSEGASLLPVPASGLAAYAGQPADATSAPVESVVSDEGFWVGNSTEDRVFVRLVTGGAESPVQVAAGRPISFSGTVTANPPDVESAFGVTAAEGAALLTQQGHHIEVPVGGLRQG